MELIVIWLAFAIVTALAASGRGRSFGGWLILGLCFGFFALIAVLVMSPLQAPQRANAQPHISDTPQPYRATLAPAQTALAMEYFLAGDGSYSFDVVGEARRQIELEQIAGPRTAEGVDKTFTAIIEHDKFNTFDPNAMQVIINQKPVGYAPRDDAAEIMALLRERNLASAKIVTSARVTGGWRRVENDVPNSGFFGVKLDISYPFELETASARRRRLAAESVT